MTYDHLRQSEYTTVVCMGFQGTNILAYSGDFRSEAVAASTELLRRYTEDPASAGLSLCLKMADAEKTRMRLRTGALVYSIVGTILLLVGLVTMFLVVLLHLSSALILFALACIVTGTVFGMVWTAWRSAVTRREVMRRIRVQSSNLPCVALVEGLTFSRAKLLPEDIGLLLLDPVHRRICIEGLTHQYVICAKDVANIRLRRAPATASTVIAYGIGAAELVVVISENTNNPLELLKQLVCLRPRLYRRIAQSLRGAPATTSTSSAASDT